MKSAMPPKDHHRPALYLGWVDCAHATLVDQVESDQDQRRVVDECRDDLDPAVAEGHALVRGPPRDLARDEGDHQ